MRKTKSRVLEGLWLVVGLRRGPQTFSCNRDHYLHQIRPVARLPGVPMSSCDAGSPGPVFAVDHFLPPFIITLVIIWSCLCTIWRLQEDVRGVSEMMKPVFGGGDVITGQKATLPRIFTGPVQIEKMGVVWQTMSVCLAMFDLWIQRISKMSLSKSEYRRSHLILNTNMISTWKNDFIFIPLGGRSHPIPIQPQPRCYIHPRSFFFKPSMCVACVKVLWKWAVCVGSARLIKKVFPLRLEGRLLYWKPRPDFLNLLRKHCMQLYI